MKCELIETVPRTCVEREARVKFLNIRVVLSRVTVKIVGYVSDVSEYKE